MSVAAEAMLARLKRLPPRLRIAHLAALLRHERRCSYPSPRERERVVGREDANEMSVRVGGASAFPNGPHPGSRSLADPPRRGEGSRSGGRAG